MIEGAMHSSIFFAFRSLFLSVKRTNKLSNNGSSLNMGLFICLFHFFSFELILSCIYFNCILLPLINIIICMCDLFFCKVITLKTLSSILFKFVCLPNWMRLVIQPPYEKTSWTHRNTQNIKKIVLPSFNRWRLHREHMKREQLLSVHLKISHSGLKYTLVECAIESMVSDW